MSLHYENWSKGGHTPISKVENPAEHVKYFNWLPNWIEIYFFNKVSDFILGLVFVIILLTIIFYKKNQSSLRYNRNIYFIIITLFLFLIEWFYNHPSLRYGGYCLVAIMFFFPFSVFLDKYDNSLKEKKYKFVCLIGIVFIIFLGRNISRIYDEMNKYSYKPIKEPYYKVSNLHFRIDDRFKELIQNFKKCDNRKIDCKADLKPQMKKFLKNRYIFITKK